jgi:hypothetical protein
MSDKKCFQFFSGPSGRARELKGRQKVASSDGEGSPEGNLHSSQLTSPNLQMSIDPGKDFVGHSQEVGNEAAVVISSPSHAVVQRR